MDGGGGAVGGGGTEEADVDIEQAATQAPGASLISYEGPNSQTGAYDVWNQIVSIDQAQVISTSWGICEPLAAADNDVASYATLFAEAASQGESVLAASGDSGSEGCAVSDGSTDLDVDYPASDTWVTGVGGTDLFGVGDEVAWLDGGGGISRYVADPSWQPVDVHWSGAGNPCGIDCREVPDISANAGVGMEVYSGGAWSAVGGTSLAAPLVAGIVADRNDGCTTSTADLAPTLYTAASQGLYGTGLTDITSGDNDATGSYGGEYFTASSGYDPATGLGSPLAAGLSCPEVASVGPGYAGNQVVVSGLGLEHAVITFGGSAGHRGHGHGHGLHRGGPGRDRDGHRQGHRSAGHGHPNFDVHLRDTPPRGSARGCDAGLPELRQRLGPWHPRHRIRDHPRRHPGHR